MITIKKINIKIRVELIDGTTFPPEKEENYTYELKASGYSFSLNNKEVSIPHASIIKVIEQYEFQIEEQDAFELIESKLSDGITEAEIKEKLEGKGAKFSEEELKNILKKLKGRFEICNVGSRTDKWVAMEFSRKGIQLSKDMEIMKEIERTQQLNYTGEFSCENENKLHKKKKKFN